MIYLIKYFSSFSGVKFEEIFSNYKKGDNL